MELSAHRGGISLEKDYRPDIDGLRAIAVVPVVLYHFGFPGFSGGFLGVDVFFVISGYLITRLIVEEVDATGGFRFGRFYLRRLRRLFPALATVLLATTIASFFILSPDHFRLFGRELSTAVLSVSNIYYFSESGYFDVSKELKALLHTWSLGVEEQFYLLWPVLLLLCLRSGRNVLFWALAGMSIASLAFAELLSDRDLVFFLTPFRAFEFAAGATLVWLTPLRPKGRLADVAVVAGLFLIALSVHFFSSETRLPGVLSLAPVLGAALCIHAGAAGTASGWLLRNGPCVWIGRISYSLYLVHWPLIVLVVYAVPSLTAVQRGALLAVCVILATLLHHLVEQPLRHPRSVPAVRFLAVSGTAIVACLALAATITLGKGWPWRLPPETAALLASAKRVSVLDSPCQYRFKRIDETLQAKFDGCAGSTGNAVLVVGDSHAGDLFHALAINGKRQHVVGVWVGGCRPITSKSCFYEDLGGFVERNRSRLDAIIYVQRGDMFLSAGMRPPVLQAPIDAVAAYLRTVAAIGVPTFWVGPHWEPNYEVNKIVAMVRQEPRVDYFRDHNPYIPQVDRAIEATMRNPEGSVTYISAIDLLGPMTLETFIIDNEYTYADEDHWSARGEEVFGARIVAGSPVLKALFNPPVR